MNNIFLEEVFYLGTFPFIACIIHYFFKHCLGCRIGKKLYIFIVYFLYCLISCGLYIASLPGSISLLLNFSLLILLSYFYKKSLIWRTGAAAFIIAVLFLSDTMVQSFLVSLFPSYTTSIYIISLFLSKIIMLSLTYAAVQISTSYGKGSLSVWYWIFLLFCPVISFLGLYGLVQYFNFTELPWLYPAISVGLIFINFFVFILCDRVLRIQTIQAQASLLEQQINYYKHQYLLAESTQRETLQFRHDMKNILIGLQAKLETGEVSESRQILNTLINDFNSSKTIAHSGNMVIDSIINYKKQAADSLNIPFHLDLRIPADIILDSTAISVILGNALDNAIEACQRVESCNKYVKTQMHYQNDSLFIHIENPYAGTIRTNLSGRILSAKPDHKSHGIGISSIRDMVEKMHGLLDIDFKNGIFNMEIVLFNVKREKTNM